MVLVDQLRVDAVLISSPLDRFRIHIDLLIPRFNRIKYIAVLNDCVRLGNRVLLLLLILIH
jgi:hypothetical protein